MAVSVNELPAQTFPPVAVMVGLVLTVMVATAAVWLIQPSTEVPVMVYDAVAEGVITGPDEKVYVLAPEGVRVKLAPSQIEPLATVMVGLLLTTTVAMAADWLTQPSDVVPVTLYTVVAEGVTTEPDDQV